VTGTPWAFVARHDDAIRPPRAGAPSRGGQPSGGAHQLTVCRNANARINARAFRTSEVVSELLEVVGSPGWARTSDFLINSQALYQLSYRGMPCIVTHLAHGRRGLTTKCHRKATTSLSAGPRGRVSFV